MNTTYTRPMTEVEELVIGARGGDEAAWTKLVQEFEDLVWRVARSYQLSDADAMDACQSTWLKVATKLDTLNDPKRFAGWISTIADRESVNVIRRRNREQPREDPEQLTRERSVDDTDEGLLVGELRGRVRRAFLALSIECRNLLSLLTMDPPPSYATVSVQLDMPVGSIGPTRQRCLTKLRALLQQTP